MRTYTTFDSLLTEPVPSVGETVNIGGRLYTLEKLLTELVDKNIPHYSITFVPVEEPPVPETLEIGFRGAELPY